MCQMFAAYVRKTARLRDKADILVREIGMYADTETPNLKRGMKQFADYLAKIEDYRQAEVKLQCLISCCFSNRFIFMVKMCIVIVNKGHWSWSAGLYNYCSQLLILLGIE